MYAAGSFLCASNTLSCLFTAGKESTVREQLNLEGGLKIKGADVWQIPTISSGRNDVSISCLLIKSEFWKLILCL